MLGAQDDNEEIDDFIVDDGTGAVYKDAAKEEMGAPKVPLQTASAPTHTGCLILMIGDQISESYSHLHRLHDPRRFNHMCECAPPVAGPCPLWQAAAHHIYHAYHA